MRPKRNARKAKFCAGLAALALLWGCSVPADSARAPDAEPEQKAASDASIDGEESGDDALKGLAQTAAIAATSMEEAGSACEAGPDGIQACLPQDQASSTASGVSMGFGIDDVRRKAKQLVAEPFVAPPPLPKSASDLNYDQYRRIESRAKAALWVNGEDGFRAQLDPRGYLFSHDVRINVIEDGKVQPRPYAASDFDFHDLPLAEEVKKSLGYAGFRVLTVLNRAGKFDELVSFKGASFFRALGSGTVYGASARGLSIGTASAGGEEFPYFTEFWLVKPASAADTATVYALMNGDSITGAFQFDITPGPETQIDVTSSFYPRRDIASVGVSPLTSMYFFSPHDLRKQQDDFRPAVHDSEGLMIWMANGEWVWRPLINPQSLQVSVLATAIPRGFGLIQRKRGLEAYSDVEADYHLRPNVWVEPRSDWGEGNLSLVEIPTGNEYNDNVVVFWKPAAPWLPGRTYNLSYRMKWSLLSPATSAVVPISATRSGKTPDKRRQMFVIDYEPADEILLEDVEAKISTSSGTILNPIIKKHPQTGKTRLTFELSSENGEVAELRALLTKGGKPVSETWLYRWRPE